MSFISQTSQFELNPPNTIIRNVPCHTTTYIGSVVRMFGGIAVNAIADSLDNANVIGIIEDKATMSECTIRFLGVTSQIFTGLDVSKEYYLSDVTPGELTTTIPTISGHVVLKIGQPYTDKQFLVSKGIRTVRA